MDHAEARLKSFNANMGRAATPSLGGGPRPVTGLGNISRFAPPVPSGGGMSFGPVLGAAGAAIGVAAVGFKAAEAYASAFFAAVKIGLGVMASLASVGYDVAESTARIAAEYQLAAVSFEVMLGSQRQGRALLEELNQLAIRTPFTSREMINGAKTLLGMGVAGEQVVPVLSRLGDIAAGDADKLRRLSLAFGQVMAAGRFMGTELRQFTEAGVGVADFARAAGVGTIQFRAMMEAGQIGPGVMIRAINELTSAGGRFEGMNERASRTVAGAWNSMTEAVTLFQAKVGEQVFERFDIAGKIGIAAGMLGSLQSRIEPIMQWMERGRGSAAALVDIVGGLSLGVGELASRAFEFAPTWGQVERTMRRIATDVLPILAAGFQEIARLVSKFLAMTLLAIKGAKDAAKMVWGPNTTIGTFIRGGEDTWAAGAGESMNTSINRTVRSLVKASQDIGKADWQGTMQKLVNSIVQGRQNLERQMAVASAIRPHPGAHMAIGGAALPASLLGIRPPADLIRDSIKVAIDTTQLATSLEKAIRDGLSPLDEYRVTLGRIDEAVWGVLRSGGALAGAAAGGAAFIPGTGGGLGPEAANLGMFQAFEKLEKAVGSMEYKLPSAAMQGSKEAIEAITAANLGDPSKDREQQIIDILRKAEEQRAEGIRKQDETVRILTDINRKGIGLVKKDP